MAGKGVRWLHHYSSVHSILIVGDGDFSFSLSLAAAFGSGYNLVATSLDSFEALIGKYSEAEANVRELKRMGPKVLHGINAKSMQRHSYLVMRRFHRIVFNFPHAGFVGKEYELHMVKYVYSLSM
uniref:25S rRNA (uridine-N(3))-methyltransferase BMT5-like domain-containing protein n=1 Tax=Triticum urartu TaxID=4572 RepID=A0A8R7UGX3_TRIUA